MKTERGRRKAGRRLGLPNVERGDAIRRVSLHPPVGHDALAPRPEAPDLAGEAQPRDEGPISVETAEVAEAGTPRPPEGEQP